MKKILIAFFLSVFVASTPAEIVVIANVDNHFPELNNAQITDIFMGRLRSLPNGRLVLPLDQANLRPEFYQKLTSRPIEQINAYWARVIFTGQTSPPMNLPDDNAVLTTVNEKKDAIGYVDKKNVDNRVQVLLILN